MTVVVSLDQSTVIVLHVLQPIGSLSLSTPASAMALIFKRRSLFSSAFNIDSSIATFTSQYAFELKCWGDAALGKHVPSTPIVFPCAFRHGQLRTGAHTLAHPRMQGVAY